MKTHAYVSTTIVALSLLCVGGKVGAVQSHDDLKQAMPARWQETGDFASTASLENDRWWTSFNDSLLDSLIDMGLTNNYNLDITARRLSIAHNTMRQAQSGFFPTIGFSGGWTRARTSGNTTKTPVDAGVNSYWNLGLNLSWEIDIFGKIASRVGQERAAYNASKAEYEGAMLSLAASIAKSYIQLRVWQAELDVANSHIESQDRVLKITEDRLDCGLGNMLEVTQARGVCYSTKASIPKLESAIRTAINSLAIMVGVYPEEIYDRLDRHSPLPDYHQLVPIGIPADLLRRRPDVVAAQMELEEYAKALGIAQKDFLPTLTLDGSIGTMAHDASNLFEKRSVTYSISPTLSWTLFDGLQRKYNAAIAREQLQIGIDNYNYTVMTAVQDTDNALSSYKASLLYIDAITKLLEQSNKSLSLSLDLYKSSLVEFTNVVDAQMSVLENQNQLIVAQGDAIIDIIQLYEAIGGGWNGLQ